MNIFNRDPTTYLVLAVVFIVSGLMLLFVLASSREKVWKRCTAEVYGNAVGVTRTSRSRGGFYYNFTLEFEVDGRKYTDNYTECPEVEEGERLRILYDPDDPSVHCVPVVDTSPLLTRLTGAVLILIGTAIFIKASSVIKKRSNAS